MEHAEDVETGILEEVSCSSESASHCSIVYRKDDPGGRGSRVRVFLQSPHGREHEELHPGGVVHAYHGMHGEVRGLIIDGAVLWMWSEQESSERMREELRAAREQLEARDDERYGSLASRWAALPEPFRAICGPCADTREFRRTLFVVEEAAKILAVCGSREEIDRFAASPAAEQQRRVPRLSDAHSGGTFAAAVSLARELAPREASGPSLG